MWWRACDNANIGVRTGNGLLVLDVDPRNGGYESPHALVTKHGHLPATPTVSTGGGGQHFYLAVQGKVPCKQSLWPGIDVKGDGGYVVAPPSVHASGAAYAWENGRGLDDLALAPAPTWLLGAVVSGVTPKVELGNPNVIQAGERNSHLMSLAGRSQVACVATERTRNQFAKLCDLQTKRSVDRRSTSPKWSGLPQACVGTKPAAP